MADALEWIFGASVWNDWPIYLDDFILLGPLGSQNCKEDLETSLGLLVKVKKSYAYTLSESEV